MCRCPAQSVVETIEEHRKLHFTFLNHMSPRGLVGLTKEGVHMVTTGEFTTTQACLANAGGVLEAMAAYMDPLYEKIQVARAEQGPRSKSEIVAEALIEMTADQSCFPDLQPFCIDHMFALRGES